MAFGDADVDVDIMFLGGACAWNMPGQVGICCTIVIFFGDFC